MTPPRGLLLPFQRDRKRDFASGSAAELLAAKVEQVLAIEGETPRSSGELPWRTAFGSGLHLLRHQRNDAALAALARVYVRDALKRWAPEAELMDVTVVQAGATLTLHVRFRATGPAEGAGATELAVELRR